MNFGLHLRIVSVLFKQKNNLMHMLSSSRCVVAYLHVRFYDVMPICWRLKVAHRQVQGIAIALVSARLTKWIDASLIINT